VEIQTKTEQIVLQGFCVCWCLPSEAYFGSLLRNKANSFCKDFAFREGLPSEAYLERAAAPYM